jgi:hypothetical protein
MVPLTKVTLDDSMRSVKEPSNTLDPLACDAVSVAMSLARSSGSFSVHVKPSTTPLEHASAANTLGSKRTSTW